MSSRRLIGVPLLCSLLWFSTSPAAAQAPRSDVDELYSAGRSSFEQGRTLEALTRLRKVADEQPGFRDVHLLLGQCYLAVGREREARRHFERFLQDQPGHGHATFLLGLSLYQAARYVEAAQVLYEAQIASGENPYPYSYRGLSLLRLGQPASVAPRNRCCS